MIAPGIGLGCVPPVVAVLKKGKQIKTIQIYFYLLNLQIYSHGIVLRQGKRLMLMEYVFSPVVVARESPSFRDSGLSSPACF
jgi:hypothetical protein